MIKATIVGHVGQVKYAEQTGDNGFQVLNFSVASNATTRKGEKITNWVSCKLWGPRAKQLSEHLVKGQAVAIEGRPEARGYQAETGIRGDLVVHVNLFEFVGGKPDAAPAEVTGDPAPDAAAE